MAFIRQNWHTLLLIALVSSVSFVIMFMLSERLSGA